MLRTSPQERAVARLAARALLRGALIWGAVFALVAITSIVAYRSTYGTAAERARLLHGLAANGGVRALFGPMRDLGTVAGFTAWRTLGLVPLVTGTWGLLAATRLLRGEEDTGRWDLVLAAPITRVRATLATLAGVAAGALVLFACTAAALLAAGAAPGSFTVGGALWLALALCIAAPAFAAAGAVAAQLAPGRRQAASTAGAVFAAAFVVRAAADGSASASWLRWVTPLGWVEELHPAAPHRLVALAALVAWTAALVAVTAVLARGRDAGAAPLAGNDARPPRRRGLRSVEGLALRESLGAGAAWCTGLGLAALLYGYLAKAVGKLAASSPAVARHVESTMGAHVDLGRPEDYLAIIFAVLGVAVALFAASQVAAAREEESGGRLDTLLAGPITRGRWLRARLLVAVGWCVAATAGVALGAAAGVAIGGAHAGLAHLLEAAANLLPLTAVFLGVGVLALGYLPRHTGAAGFGAIGAAYLWQQVGELVGAPAWTLAPSPFHWLALVPTQPFDAVASAGLLAAGGALAAAGAARFLRRDLVGA